MKFQKKKDKKKKEDSKKVITYDKPTPKGEKKGTLLILNCSYCYNSTCLKY